ncbi:formyltransferase family protein [Nitratireductor sp. XY-223]|uniref:formyltransferase family protein n=1 Tax=Nitratireductor sp. XY-223 TaxID=2561926 RepID=UPI00145BA427|nr:formyltransferase family protein [Nitratireductor sp. XY-223]
MADAPDRFHALIIAENNLISSAFVDAWLACGNTIAAFWTKDEKSLASDSSQKLLSLASAVPTLEEQIRRHAIPVVRNGPLKNRPETSDLLSATGADTLITLMTHQIVPDWMLDQFGKRAVNVHPALLPFYKGPKPTFSLLVDGEVNNYGGITVHRLDSGIDTGDIIAQRKLPMAPGENFNVWIYRLALAAAEIARAELQSYLQGALEAVPQVEGSGSYRKSSLIDFCVEPRKTADDVRRLFSMPAGVEFRAVAPDLPGRRQSIAIHRSFSVVSAPTGEAPRLTPLFIEMDIRDARIRLLRMRKAVSMFKHASIPVALYQMTRLLRGSDPD